MFEIHLTITNSRGPMYSVLSRYKVVRDRELLKGLNPNTQIELMHWLRKCSEVNVGHLVFRLYLEPTWVCTLSNSLPMVLDLWTSHLDLICLSHCSIWCLWVKIYVVNSDMKNVIGMSEPNVMVKGQGSMKQKSN